MNQQERNPMSKHMQLVVQVNPYYKNGLEGIYPRVADALDSVLNSKTDSPLSLFDIVGKLDRVLYELEGNPPFRKIFLGHQQKLQKLHMDAQALIADWKLAEVDKILYQMEDIFDDIEWELGGV